MEMKQFKNLEELLVKVMDAEQLKNRIVTDVLVNNESFTEIYPHQAEDMETSDIERLEVVTMPVSEMAVNITRELDKVVHLMAAGSIQVADFFRQGEDSEALEVYQDLLEVTRDFLGMVGLLRDEFDLKKNAELSTAVEELSDLFSEILEVQENEDWTLLADIMEFEFTPVVEQWKTIIATLRDDISGQSGVSHG
ncbi:MAG: hypothetical protein ACLFTB_01200, partial [Desulfovibrionales bacterium]